MTTALKYKLFRALKIVLIGVIAFVAIGDRFFGLMGYTGDVRARFDHKTFPVVSAKSADVIEIEDAGQRFDVQLLGMCAPQGDEHYSAEAYKYIFNRVKGKNAILRFETIQPLDAQGRLLAHVYLLDKDNLIQDMIKDGCAYVDRRSTHSMRYMYEAAEAEARRRKTGLWRKVTDETMPAWRRDWLEKLRAVSR